MAVAIRHLLLFCCLWAVGGFRRQPSHPASLLLLLLLQAVAPRALPGPTVPQLPFCCPWHPADLPGSSPKWQEINPEREGTVLRLGELNQLGGAEQRARKGEQGLPLLTAASGQLGRPGPHPSFGAPSTHPLASYHCQNVVEQHPNKPAELFWGLIV